MTQTKQNYKTQVQNCMQKMTRKTFRGLDTTKLLGELENIVNNNAQGLQRHIKKIEVNGEKYLAYETRVLNKHANYKGPGNWRILYNGTEFAFATHNKNGTYNIQYK